MGVNGANGPKSAAVSVLKDVRIMRRIGAAISRATGQASPVRAFLFGRATATSSLRRCLATASPLRLLTHHRFVGLAEVHQSRTTRFTASGRTGRRAR